MVVVHRSPARAGCMNRPVLQMPEEDQLVSALRELCTHERELESAKTALILKADFNLYDCFGIFDPNRRGMVGVHDIREGLS
jgi:hypothetical protein